MKKYVCLVLSILLLVGVLTCCWETFGGTAFAREQNGASFKLEVENKTVELTTLTLNGDPVGVRMYDTFFGNSDIPVQINVYSSDDFTIDFRMDADVSTLTAAQLRNRQIIADLFSGAVGFICKIDNLANTQYDGTQGNALSDVYRYNHASDPAYGAQVVDGGYKMEIAFDTYVMLSVAQEMYEATNHAFNPAVYRLVDLWGFSSRTYFVDGDLPYDRVWKREVYPYEYPLPEQKYVEAFSDADFTDFSQKSVQLSQADGKYYVTKKVAPVVVDGVSYEQWIDLGGIAKGYVVDGIRAQLNAAGIERFDADAGSSSIAFGLNYDGGNFILSPADAFAENSWLYQTPLLELQIGKSSVSTSGQNVRKYVVDGVEYAHIVDGTTGAPAQKGVRSVTVVIPDESSGAQLWATKGDCLTTALTIMGYDGIVNFIGGYLKDNGIKILVQYETLSGSRQLLTTFGQDEISGIGEEYGQLQWDERGFFHADLKERASRAWVLIVIGCVLGAGGVALIVYHFLRGRDRVRTNVVNAKKDKPFKVLDVMVYVCVALLILVLFYALLFSKNSVQMQAVSVIDEQTGETLFTYNFTRNDYTFNTANSNGWQIGVETVDDGLEVTFTRDFNGEARFNKLKITRGADPSVKMIDSRCGKHQDCVRNFPALTRTGGAIVCSPNLLKVITA